MRVYDNGPTHVAVEDARKPVKTEAKRPEDLGGWQRKIGGFLHDNGPHSTKELREKFEDVSSGQLTGILKALARQGLAEPVGMKKNLSGPPSPVWQWIGAGKGEILGKDDRPPVEVPFKDRPPMPPALAERLRKRETVIQPGLGLREGRVTV